MPVKMSDIAACMEKLAPFEIAEKWDNVGLLIGGRDWKVSRVLVALDISDDIVSEAIEINADCIITHHPIIFTKLGRITDDTPHGKRLIKLIQNNISVYSAHTNLDMVSGGTADIFADLLELRKKEFLCGLSEEKYALGRVGDLKKAISLEDLAWEVKTLLCLKNINYMGDSGRMLKRVGVLPGSGCDHEYLVAAVSKQCDVLITGDIKYHAAQEALDMGLALIDATHYGGEILIVDKICDYLKSEIKEIDVISSKIDGQLIKNI